MFTVRTVLPRHVVRMTALSVAALAVTGAARANEPGPRKLDSDILSRPLAYFDQMVKDGWTLDKGYERESYTPLMTAIERGRADLVEWLLRQGAQPNRVDDVRAGGWYPTFCTPLYFAAQQTGPDAIRVLDLLIKAGAHLAGDPRCERPPVNAAVNQGNLASVRFLLSKGADPNSLSRSGNIPLTEPVPHLEKKHALETAQELLRGGALVNRRDALGQSVLLLAAMSDNAPLEDLLLSKGADPRLTDTRGLTALSWAQPGKVRDRMLALAEQLKGSIPAPVFVRSKLDNEGSLGPYWIGKDVRVGVLERSVRVVDPTGKELASLPVWPAKSDGTPLPEVLDVDGDRVPDFSLLVKEAPNFFGVSCSLYLSLRGGQSNLLVNYDSDRERLTGGAPLDPALRGPVAAELRRRTLMPAEKIDALLGGYTLMVDAPYLASLEKLHGEASRAYKAKKPARAVALLEDALNDLTVAKMDPGQDPNVTAIMNDYGFFLAEAGMNDRAVAVLTTVLARAPDRTVAYLNLADAEYAQGWKDEARGHYRGYRERMRGENKAAKVPPRVAERIAEP